VEGISCSHYLFERHCGLLAEENREVFDAAQLHQLGLVANQVGAQEVEKELRLLIFHKEMVDKFQPVILA